MWHIEEFGNDDYLVRTYPMPDLSSDILRKLIEIKNTEDWISGVGHPIELNELGLFSRYLIDPIDPRPTHSYFAADLSVQ